MSPSLRPAFLLSLLVACAATAMVDVPPAMAVAGGIPAGLVDPPAPQFGDLVDCRFVDGDLPGIVGCVLAPDPSSAYLDGVGGILPGPLLDAARSAAGSIGAAREAAREVGDVAVDDLVAARRWATAVAPAVVGATAMLAVLGCPLAVAAVPALAFLAGVAGPP